MVYLRDGFGQSLELHVIHGLLRTQRDTNDQIPSLGDIVFALVQLWEWVAANGVPDSDSVDYLVPSVGIESLETRFGISGLIDAMCDPRVNWCRREGSHVHFCRFSEWNGPDVMRRLGASKRAQRSRERSKQRMLRAPHHDAERKTGALLSAKTSTKAHAKRDTCHAFGAQETDVDVDVSLRQLSLKTSTSDDNLAAPPETATVDRLDLFPKIRQVFRSPADATDAAVAKDRELAWKVATVVADCLGPAWLDQVIASARRQAKLRRPYAYLWNSIDAACRERRIDVRSVFAAIDVPHDLASIDTAPERIEPDRPKPIDPATLLEREKVAYRKELIRRGVRGDELVALLDEFDKRAEGLICGQ